jgi:hypothetical protein
MMRGTVWLVAAMVGLGAGLVSTAGGASGPQQTGSAQAAAPAKAGDDQTWGEPSDEPVQAGQNPPAATPEQTADAPAVEPKNAPKKDTDEAADEPVQAGQAPSAATPEQTGDAPPSQPKNAAKKDADDPISEPVHAGPPAPPPSKPDQAGSVQAADPVQAKPPALALPAATPEQQQLERDTAELLHLVQELKVEVDKAGTDTLSLAAVRKADEIQRLAKTLKERMREREQEPGNKP